VIVDDRLVLFSSVASEAGGERIEAVPLDGGGRTVVVERAVAPMVSPTGHLLFMRDDALTAAPFDPRASSVTAAIRVTGSATVHGEGGLGPPAPVISSSGSLLHVAAGAGAREVLVVDRQGAARPLGVADGMFSNPRLTRDGLRLLLEERSTVLRVLDIARGTMMPLGTPAPMATGYPTWNLDGSRAVFRRFSPFWAATDGTGRTGRIPNTTVNDFPSAAGPAPDSILVTRIQPDTGGDAYLISITGAFEPRALVQSRAYDGGASFSPDRRWLLYQSAESGSAEIYVRPYPGLERAWQVSAGGGVQARWSPSGREVFYRNGSQMLAVSIDFSAREPVLRKPVLLFDQMYASSSSISTANYDVTPDGRFIMLRPLAGASRLILTTNWVDELTKALAAGAPQH
jgi:hypothetical protein